MVEWLFELGFCGEAEGIDGGGEGEEWKSAVGWVSVNRVGGGMDGGVALDGDETRYFSASLVHLLPCGCGFEGGEEIVGFG